VDQDVLKLSRKAGAFRYRLDLSAGSRGAKPRLLRAAVAVDDSTRPPEPEPPFSAGPWVRELMLRPRSQMHAPMDIRRDICSPSSLAMVLEFWGRRLGTLEVARLAQDRAVPGSFGNWTLNVAAAGALGLCGEVAWLDSMLSLQEEIASGRPAIVSIGYPPGGLSGAPVPATKGHLLVVAGFTRGGDVIAYDPAGPEAALVRRVYRRGEFERAWLGAKRGLAYRLAPPLPQELRLAVPCADLMDEPGRPARGPMDPLRGTQLLFGERVRALEPRGDWVRVEALEQEHWAPGGLWRGYPGWVRSSELGKGIEPYRPGWVVAAKRALARPAGGGPPLPLPLGSRLARAEDGLCLLPDGRKARVEARALRRLDEPRAAPRTDVLEAASLFVGDRYVWGGRSSAQRARGWGVDCSGLVGLAYRCALLSVPRDARDQFLGSRRLRRRDLRPADLVFLTDAEELGSVNHVMIYAGGEDIIESRANAGRTLRTSFPERFGLALSSIESGDAPLDLSARPPVRRRIYFGAFLP
jgi:hypothetical protein